MNVHTPYDSRRASAWAAFGPNLVEFWDRAHECLDAVNPASGSHKVLYQDPVSEPFAVVDTYRLHWSEE